MTETRIRPMDVDEVEPALELVMKAFDEFVAPDFPPEGIDSFTEWANPAALAERIREGHMALVAVQAHRIVGVIEWILPDHVSMLFVDPASQGQGIGRRLFEDALLRVRGRCPELGAVRVHASRYAIPFYRRLGFRETDPECERDGVRFTAMQLELDSRPRSSRSPR